VTAINYAEGTTAINHAGDYSIDQEIRAEIVNAPDQHPEVAVIRTEVVDKIDHHPEDALQVNTEERLI
jgi:hypothetical protein